MALKNESSKRSSSLHFRILAPIVPIIILMVILGSAVFSVGLKTVSHNARVLISEDLERTAREIYNICDRALQALILDGYSDVESIAKVRQGNTLGKIEDYARQQKLQILVYEAAEKPQDRNILLQHTSIPVERIIQAVKADSGASVTKIAHEGTDYYANRFEFELWNWRIILVKDGATYAKFIDSISQSYFIICGILLIATVVLIMYFRRVVHQPVRSIIGSIQSGDMPSYKGIYEFEFLSNIIREATEREQKKQAEMSFQASHDPLTGLANRREFERCLNQALSEDAPLGTHTILYLDLDQFKIINDTCGHHAGDALLQQISRVMRDRLRQSDLLARLGGDEFGVLLENCAEEPSMRIAESLRMAVSDFRFAWEGKIFAVGVSIGMLSFKNDGLDLADLLSDVDSACYMAKEKGRNRIHVYRSQDSQLLMRKGQMNWVARINEALEKNRFILFRQKIVALQENVEEKDHFEILVRMIDEHGSLIPPASFIPAAERYNLMPAIDFWVIRHAFAYCRSLAAENISYTCAINLSATTIANEQLVAHICEQFRETGISPTSICFELTETAAIADLASAAGLVRELRQLGCRIALDDFGSGMSSFGYLKNLPVDFLKIDGRFVKNMLNDRIDRAMVNAINYIGHTMGIKTVAEFVEDDATLEKLKEIKVDFAQGYGIGMPEALKVSRSSRAADEIVCG
ncbi:MAG: EAL domain-containing protein [Burkholderiaceae bacterium]